MSDKVRVILANFPTASRCSVLTIARTDSRIRLCQGHRWHRPEADALSLGCRRKYRRPLAPQTVDEHRRLTRQENRRGLHRQRWAATRCRRPHHLTCDGFGSNRTRSIVFQPSHFGITQMVNDKILYSDLASALIANGYAPTSLTNPGAFGYRAADDAACVATFPSICRRMRSRRC